MRSLARPDFPPTRSHQRTWRGSDQSSVLFAVLGGCCPLLATLQPWDLAPEIFITATAPTRGGAVALANGAVRGLVLYLRSRPEE